MMGRSFDRRLESLFLITDEFLKQQSINLLHYNLLDNVNAYIMHEDGSYSKRDRGEHAPFNIHEEFYRLTPEIINEAVLFE